MARVYVGGPSGSGKTEACKRVAQELGISCLTGSQIMMKAAGVTTRAELEGLSEDRKADLRLHAFESYYETTPNLVIDGHFFLTATDMRYFDAYVLVEIEPEYLIEFRKADFNRQRSIDVADIKQETADLHQRVTDLETEFGIRVIRVKNDSTLDELSRSIEGVYVSACSPEVRAELTRREKENLR